jgi:tRNA dimethylallyltransferase
VPSDRLVAVTVVLVGPTAVGKSTLAVALAERFGAHGRPAEVINADSMLLYRGMDIGTAKPTAAERRNVPHHLIDILDVGEPATVAEFQRLARTTISDCRTRDVVPIVVGGSALYVRAIVDDFSFPGTDPAIRAALEDELAGLGPQELHARLARRDPDAAARIEPGNGRRIVRALEVLALTGRPFRASLPPHHYVVPDVIQIGLDIDRATLDRRVAARVEAMWDAGLVAEVRALEAAGLRSGRTASRALGYRQVLDLLAGEISEAEAKEQTIAATRRFARRQDSWFRKDPRIRWLRFDDPRLVESAYLLAAENEARPVLPTSNGSGDSPAARGGLPHMED